MNFETEISAFLVSDAARHQVNGLVQAFGANSLAHFAIGSIAGAAVFLLNQSLAWLLIPLAMIVGKEVFFDIPNSWGEPLVVLDSIWDLACYLAGFAFNFWAVMAEPKEKNHE